MNALSWLRAVAFPGSTADIAPDDVLVSLVPGERLVTVAGPGEAGVACVLRPPNPGRRWTLFLYGNAMTLADTRFVRDALGRDGDGVACVDYPGFGLSDAAPSEAGCYRAADAALMAICRSGGRPDQLSVIGWSLGSAVAVDLASRHPVRRLVLLSPMTSLVAAGASAWIGGWVPALDRGPFAAVRRAPAVGAPTLLVVGSADRLTPPRMAEALRDQLGGPTRLEIRPGRGHQDLLADAATWALIKEFLADAGTHDGTPR